MIGACGDHVGHNAHTSKRLKRRLLQRFKRSGGCVPREVYGYVKPPGCAAYDDLQRDPAATPVYREWFRRLLAKPNCSAVADWLNAQGVPPGPYARKGRWDGKMVRRLTRNTLLIGMPARGFRRTVKVHEHGRWVSVPNSNGPTFREQPYPHLAHVDADLFDAVNARLDEANAKSGRKPGADGLDPLYRVPRGRSRCPGRHAVCWYCGREYVWGGNGVAGHLMCGGAREWQCWNSIGFDGPRAARLIARELAAAIAAVDGVADHSGRWSRRRPGTGAATCRPAGVSSGPTGTRPRASRTTSPRPSRGSERGRHWRASSTTSRPAGGRWTPRSGRSRRWRTGGWRSQPRPTSADPARRATRRPGGRLLRVRRPRPPARAVVRGVPGAPVRRRAPAAPGPRAARPRRARPGRRPRAGPGGAAVPGTHARPCSSDPRSASASARGPRRWPGKGSNNGRSRRTPTCPSPRRRRPSRPPCASTAPCATAGWRRRTSRWTGRRTTTPSSAATATPITGSSRGLRPAAAVTSPSTRILDARVSAKRGRPRQGAGVVLISRAQKENPMTTETSGIPDASPIPPGQHTPAGVAVDTPLHRLLELAAAQIAASAIERQGEGEGSKRDRARPSRGEG